jgi:hypothetical protein
MAHNSKFVNIVPGRLWAVNDLLPADQADEILAVDWLALSQQSGDANLPRRKQIAWNNPVAQQVGQYIDQQLPAINQSLGTEFAQISGHFWIDLPGFACSLHTDGHLPTAMQLYWTVPGPEWGTGFYHFKDPQQLLYQFASVPNSGYIMLNHLNPDGSQPLQWHAMLNPVPEGHIRVTSYWSFK